MCTCSQSVNENLGLDTSLQKEQENAQKGLLRVIECECFSNDGKKEVFNIDDYKFLTEENSVCPPTVNENLWEQAKLNMNYGLYHVNCLEREISLDSDGKYEVKAGDVFQIRGFDLANMTIVYDGKGWVVMDVLTTKETAGYAWEKVVKECFSQTEITMVIYSHSHIDHYGGVGGLKCYFNKEGFKILAPEGFTQHAVSENIYAGTAMSRRASYQYGSCLNIDAEGQVDCGLGKRLATGTNTLIAPDWEIGYPDNGKVYTSITSNRLKMYIQFTPGTEAPAEMNVYIKKTNVLFIAENCAGTLHNALTPRGAQVRDLLGWANFLDQTLVIFPDIEVVCSAHNWPHFGSDDCRHFIEIQRDMYRYINNATLYLVNLGYTIEEVGRIISGEDKTMPVPKDFLENWCCYGFYGTFNHNAKAVYQRYIGWYDGNPAHLNKHKPSRRADLYIKAFTAEAIANEAEKALKKRDYVWAAELYDYIFNADANLVKGVIDDARKNYAETLRQMGYQSEASTWRNMYLTAAKEIKYNTIYAKNDSLKFEDDTIQAMTLEMILQYLGIMLNSIKVGIDNYSMAMNITVWNDDPKKEHAFQKKEHAFANVNRGVLNYRMLKSPSAEGNITIKGLKLDFFRAFVDGEIAKLNDISQNSNEARIFIQNYLTQFPINFPIMTPRKKMDQVITKVNS